MRLRASQKAQLDNSEANLQQDDRCDYSRRGGYKFSDRASLIAEAGAGGDGCALCVAKIKGMNKAGAYGGSGGPGGSIYLVGDGGLKTLSSYPPVRANPGTRGMGKRCDGSKGEDEYISVPLGTVVHDKKTGNVLGEVLVHGEKLRVARGGRGGRGNFALKTPQDPTPNYKENGEPGESREILLELKLVADIGLVGLRTVGKSSLLAAATRAKPEISAFPSRSAVPTLAAWRCKDPDEYSSFSIVDIPGLLNDAQGRGYGKVFLRHLERCKILAYVVDGSSPDPVGELAAIKADLELYSPQLAKKPSVVVVNKIDIPAVRKEKDHLLEDLRKALGHNRIMAVSALTGENCENLMRKLNELLMSPQLQATSALVDKSPLGSDAKQTRQKPSCQVERLPNGEWQIMGSMVENAAAMVDWSSDGAEDRFHSVLIADGVYEILEEAGAQVGDIMRIGNLVLTYFGKISPMLARARLAGFED